MYFNAYGKCKHVLIQIVKTWEINIVAMVINLPWFWQETPLSFFHKFKLSWEKKKVTISHQEKKCLYL